MFKKIASEALGLSDIGVIIQPADYGKVDADDYLFHEDGERIFFLIKSKKDEYCFTNLGLIHVDGESAVSSKRTIKRYDYASSMITDVRMETAGTIDMDVELKFTIADVTFSIDVRKNFIESVKDIYKTLYTIGKQQYKDAVGRSNAMTCLNTFGSMFKINSIPSDDALVRHYHVFLAHVNRTVLELHTKRDYSDVFEKYIKN